MKKQRSSVEINGVFYKSINCAGISLMLSKYIIKLRCLSCDYPNYKIVPFRVTYTEKTCCACKKIKSLKEFCKKTASIDGFANKCKQCGSEYDKKYYQDNAERCKKRQKELSENNPNCRKKYRESHRVELNEYSRLRLKNNSLLKLNSNIRNAIGRSLRGMKGGRHWEDLVGWTAEEGKKHLESLFTEGMSWGNYGRGKYKWSLDHIIAVRWWNITSTDCQEFKDCWALKNLQPLWHVRNVEKGDRPMHPKYLIKPF